ncbi:PadR family transcriptional regulator [bacterium]|nr:helix-turn-helix transcriptional regulator [bacterium]MBU3956645.1 PadR family transcriptional regulator [bacterium]MBU4134550.1 PadR family transcriptional regulator [bacterium]
MIRYKIALLGLLKEMPMHGYEINRQIEERHMRDWAKIKMASIYNNLLALNKKGLVEVRKKKIGKMPERKVYHITSRGSRELNALLKKGLSCYEGDSNAVFLLSLGFMTHLSGDKALAALNVRKNSLKVFLKQIIDIHRGLIDKIPFNWAFIIINSTNHMKTEIKNMEAVIKSVKKSAKGFKK